MILEFLLLIFAFKEGLESNYCGLDVLESVHRDTTMEITNKMQLYRLIYYSKSALHVSDDIFAHRREHLTVFTVSGTVHPSCSRQ